MNNTKNNEQIATDEWLQELVLKLSSHNGMERRQAREALVDFGSAATNNLIECLTNPDTIVRWEAAKALISIDDPVAAPTLVKSLMDESFEVQWLAAEALIALGETALKPLLEGLISDYESVYMRQGVHHVLHDLERKNLLSPATHQALEDLRCLEPIEPYPVSAQRALEELSKSKSEETATGSR